MRVLVTGTGLIGTYTAAELLSRGHEVVLFDLMPDEAYVRSVVGARPVALHRGDVADFPTLVDLMLAERVECVIHTVGLISTAAQRQPWAAVRTNVLGTVYVAEAARLTGAKRLVFTSTHGVYDRQRLRDAPITESSPTSSALVYGACKLSAEHLLQAYSGAYDLDVIALRFSNVYGRGLYVAGSVGGAQFHALVEPIARGEVGRVLPFIKGRREWVYVKDAAHALTLAAERSERSGYLVACIGSGVLETHEDMMAAIRAVVPEARFEEVPPAAPSERTTARFQPYDLSYAAQTLGYRPQYDLRAGVADYLQEVRQALGQSQSAI